MYSLQSLALNARGGEVNPYLTGVALQAAVVQLIDDNPLGALEAARASIPFLHTEEQFELHRIAVDAVMAATG